MKRVKDAIKILENERECVLQADQCDRNCAICPLVKDSKDIINAYDLAIEVLRNIKEYRYVRKDRVYIAIKYMTNNGMGKKKALDYISRIVAYDNETDNL